MIAKLAAGQHGVMSRQQLLAAGLTRSMIEERVGSRHLVRVHRGVFAPGHTHLRREGLWLAAVLAAGRGAVLSHRSAAALHGLTASSGTKLEVTTAARGATIAGVRVHSRRVLAADDRTTVAGIPATSVARTLIDLADVLPMSRLRKAFEQAERIRVFDGTALTAALDRTRGRHGPGSAAIRTVLAEGTTVSHTRSELEDRFLDLLDRHGLPRPLVNGFIEGMEVDACWPAARVVVELDGWAYHRTRQAFQRDRTRSNDLTAAGYATYSFTFEDVVRRPAAVAQIVSRALAAARPPRRSAPPAP